MELGLALIILLLIIFVFWLWMFIDMLTTGMNKVLKLIMIILFLVASFVTAIGWAIYKWVVK